MSSNGQPSVTVCVGQPSDGVITPGAARSFWRSSCGKVMLGGIENKVKLECYYANSSLLANNFNSLWCCALNNAEPVDYFAMIHGDIETEDFWADKLIEELESKNLDVLGTVVPIKTPKGVTSIALQRPDGDTWKPHCRLTMREIHQLPETFTAEDVGYPLLLNTGLWVAKLDTAWARQVRFTINDRIVYSRDEKRYIPQVEPEDWYFSRLLNDIGLKIGATRIVKVQHAGKASYTNSMAWGTETFDSEYIDGSIFTKPAETEPLKLMEV